jgi:hypothetical protein
MDGRWQGALAVSSGGVRWLGLAMATTLVEAEEVLHTTRLRWLGVTVFRSEEGFALGPDGRSGAMSGRVWVLGLPVGGYRGALEVDEDAAGATYRFRLLGGDVLQITRVEGEGALRVRQTLPWGVGEVLLRRW